MTRGLPPGGRVRAAVAWMLVALAALLLVPRAGELKYFPFTFIAAAALAGYLVRRRSTDALLLAALHWTGGFAEELVGVQFMACLVLPLLAVTWRPYFSAFAGGSAFALVVAGVHLKERFAGSLLTFQDVAYFFRQFGDNIGVMRSQPTLAIYGSLAAATFGVAAVASWRADARIRARTGKTCYAWLVVPLVIVTVGWTSGLLGEHARQALLRGAWTWSERWYDRPVSTFLSTIATTALPDVRDADTSSFRRAVADVRSVRSAEPSDIVLVLQESQFNPATIAGCAPALCEMPVFGSGAGTRAYGPLRVHVFGGGTWLSEFAFNTGVPHSLFGAAGDFAPFNVAPGVQRSFVRSLRAAGYRTVAIYPVGGGMMNARRAYEGYGFDRFLEPADLGFEGGFGTRDEPIYQALARVLDDERRHGKPVFVMVVTIFNHAEHGVEMERVPPDLTQLAERSFPDSPQVAHNVADYVWRSRLFAAAMDSASRKILAGTRPAVVGWFGDHQPPFGRARELRERIRNFGDAPQRFAPKFQTWYSIASNREGVAPASPSSPVDVVFLPGLLAQLAGVPPDEWLAANAVARERCGGLLDECVEPAIRAAYLSYLVQHLAAFGAE